MWTDIEGRYHSIALEDPSKAMDKKLLERLATVSRKEANRAMRSIAHYDEIYWAELDAMPRDADTEDAFVNQSLPATIIITPVSDSDVLGPLLVEAAKAIEPRWRGDALAAVVDFLSLPKRSRLRLLRASFDS